MSVRAILRLGAAVLWLGFCLIAWAIARPFGHGPAWVRRFLGGIGRLLGLEVTIEGEPVRGHVLYVANHISWLDILAIGGVAPARFVAKAEIARWPLVGWLAALADTVFVSRDRRSATRDQADALVAALGQDRPVALFAEGGTGDGHAVAPFRAPLFVAAGEAGVPVQPIAIDYGPARVALAWPDGVGFGAEAKRMLTRRARVPVTLRFLAPLDATRLDRKALALQAQAAVAGALR